MCLAVPMKVEQIQGSIAVVISAGMKMQVDISLTPEARVGEYLIVHAGFAIETLKPAEAEETLKLMAEMAALAEDWSRFWHPTASPLTGP